MTPSKILITGATGFIGTRFCERLTLHYRAPYRAFVRSFTRANRIARMNAELVGGDLNAPQTIRPAIEGCDAVVHMAHSEDHLAPQETRNLLEACLEAGIERLVHVSSVAVHGPSPGPECAREATAPIRRYGEPYSDSKAKVEELVRASARRDGLSAVILRPTIVYGPYSPHVLGVMADARKGDICLINEGTGICNAVYVDDVCDAIWGALKTETAVGKAFFINGDETITWDRFMHTFAEMVEPAPTFRNLSSKEVRDHWLALQPTLRSNLRAMARLARSPEFHRQLGTVPAVGSAIRWVKSTLVKHLPPEKVLELRSRDGTVLSLEEASAPSWPSKGRLIREGCSVRFSNELARNELGWRPRTDFQTGAQNTRSWLAFARWLTCPE